MRVAMYYNNRDIRIEELPVPPIAPSEMLVRVVASGICGSDVMEWYRIKKAPLVLGHEIAGEIVETGDEVKRFQEGDRVFVSHHVPCNTCRYCLKGHHSLCDTLRTTNFDPGGFSEYLRVPAINVDRGTFLLPDEMSFEEGTFIEPLACVVRGQGIADMKPGLSILVMGSGLSGLLHIQAASAQGAGRIIATDINDYRLASAKKFGADDAIHADDYTPEVLRDLNDGKLADRVIVCNAAPSAIEQSFYSTDRGGTILFFAPTSPDVTVPFPFFHVWREGITITNTYAGSPADIVLSIEMLRSGKVNVKEMITHRLSLAETAKGFDLVEKAEDSIKVIIEPQR